MNERDAARRGGPVGSQVDNVLAAIDRALPVGSRTSLSRWMRQNHDALLARIGDQQPDWVALAKVFAEAGLTDRTGKPASPSTARAAWWRVRKAVAAARAKRPAEPRPQPAVRPASNPPARAPADPAPTPENPYGFRPGKLKDAP